MARNPFHVIDDYPTVKTFKFTDTYRVVVYDTEVNENRALEIFSPEQFKRMGVEGEYGKPEDKNLHRTFFFKNCIGVELPKYEPKGEELKYGNFTQMIYLPSSDAPSPLKLTFNETENHYVRSFIEYCLMKNFYTEDLRRKAFNKPGVKGEFPANSYNPYRYLDRIEVQIWDNKLRRPVINHIFESCRIAEYDYSYGFEYQSSQPLQPTISFMFLKYTIDTNPEES